MYVRSLEWIERRMVGARGWEERDWVLHGDSVSAGEDENSGDGWWLWLHSSADVLNTTELCTDKW